MKRLLLAACIAGWLTVAWSVSASAMPALKIQPLLYEETLQQGEVKKGYIDISNPTSQKLDLVTSVEAFRQVDDEGNLEFFESEAVAAGIKLDFDKFSLEPRSAMRLMFQVDGSKLPSGDVFAALFVSTDSDEQASISQNVRVGTLLIIENGTLESRQSAVSGLQLPWLVVGGQINGSYDIKNLADTDKTTGFRPTVTIKLEPFGQSIKHQASLVFAGRERTNQFTMESSRLGVYRLSVGHGDSVDSRWVVLLPTWAIYGGLGLVVVVAGWWILRHGGYFRSKRR